MEFIQNNIIVLTLVAMSCLSYNTALMKILLKWMYGPLLKDSFKQFVVRSIFLGVVGILILVAMFILNWKIALTYVVIASVIELLPARKQQIASVVENYKANLVSAMQ